MLRNFLKRQARYSLPKGLTRRELIQREAKIGGRSVWFHPTNRSREFFRLEAGVWVWHEEWKDSNGIQRVTTRYELHGDNILKIQNEQPAVLVHGDELNNFYQAVKAYYYAVSDKVYHRPIPTN